ncbi:VOC family protein [Streptomyces nodosus]|uniref:3-demethylubiquinone-9 3-methyltransferase n=1 Tax=Streptomyces nodosus TaxID=40318 RepID=A0A0B5DJT9_9ACTN|nr:VOC family protein [Streptomyces nodosus]AJE43943.1 3-demethylubiquinone-9 3-methyltransferase [Streptomyces nodosus]MBB4795510.1 putative 3-demethylubiquinone-9 3-methyltransferase (glyoxalase superfamily) [Streptomyces nodosus]QEV42442.1 VOC family protein [Streptomyces nodosus]
MKIVTSQKVTAFLMFEGNAEEAMASYVSLFDDAEVVSMTRYGAEGPGKEGSVQHATFSLAGQQLMCIDSPLKHDFTFTPAISLFVQCENEAEIDRLYTALVEDGTELMPLGNYGFSTKFGWINDRFGVSWQLNLPA